MKMNHVPEALDHYRRKLESYTEISPEDFERLADVMYEKHFNKGEVILKEGDVCKTFNFIHKGLIRSFGLEDGREVNVNFYFENDFACDFASFRSGEPSKFYLVAMEDTVAYQATKTEAVPIFEESAGLHFFLFRFFQQLFLDEEVQANNLKLMTPEERYSYIVEYKPEYIQRIPLTYLASFLSMSRATLTRMRRKVI
jgi:CRP-like cAMP-binding protein